MNASTVLPRSLVPLDDETLPGYLMRLSHRLEISPTHLTDLIGLTRDHQHLPTRNLLQLDPAAAGALARSCRISEQAAHALTLSGLAALYPQARSTVVWNSGNKAAAPWVLTNFSRYCPQCLAGDRTPIQRAHGGTWRRTWRLPVVFACLRHGRFLEHTCPDCASPAFSSGARRDGRPMTGLLIPGDHTTLHPTQCRTPLHPARPGVRAPVCAARLDQRDPPTAPRPTSELIALQQRLLDRLSGVPTDPEQSANAAAYFADLNTVLLLITASWPRTAALLPDSAHLDATESYIARLSRHRGRARAEVTRTALLDAPPREAASCASVLAVADAILALPETESHLADLAAHARLAPAALVKLARLHQPCSKPVRTAIEPWTAVLNRAPYTARASFPRLGDQEIRFERRHVPQKLPDYWLSGPARPEKIGDRIPRRAAAVSLVQLAAGQSHAGAGAYLGLPPGCAAGLGAQAAHWKALRHNARDFLDALHHLVVILNDAGNQIDYEHRRSQLHDWQIPETDWQRIITETQRHLPKERKVDWGPWKHLAATTAVWTRITQSETRFAPALARARQTTTAYHDVSQLIRALLSGPRGRICQYAMPLGSVLADYAEDVVTSIDATAPTRTATRQRPDNTGAQPHPWSISSVSESFSA